MAQERKGGRKHAYIWSLCCRCVVGIRGDYKLRSFVRSFAYQMELRRRCRVLSGGEQASDTNAVFSAMQDVLGNWVTSCVIFAVTNPPNNEENSAQLHALRYEPGITERRLRLRPRPRPQERKKDGRHFEGGFRACLRVTNVVVRHGHNITTRERRRMPFSVRRQKARNRERGTGASSIPPLQRFVKKQ